MKFKRRSKEIVKNFSVISKSDACKETATERKRQKSGVT